MFGIQQGNTIHYQTAYNTIKNIHNEIVVTTNGYLGLVNEEIYPELIMLESNFILAAVFFNMFLNTFLLPSRVLESKGSTEPHVNKL